MPTPDQQDRETLRMTPRASLMILGFGLAVLAFLVAIDRPDWFRIRPVSGTAAAMAYAATPPADAGQPGRAQP